VPDCDAVLTDRLEDTVDYAQSAISSPWRDRAQLPHLERMAQVIGER